MGTGTRRRVPRRLAAGFCGALLAAIAAGQTRWTAEVLSGGAANAGTRLTVETEGAPRTDFSARWATRPFTTPIYWAVRLGRSGARGGWEVELVHHKIYLENPDAVVSRFEITHGFNLATVHRTWIRSGWILRAGAGAVVAHAESTVRGARASRGYRVAGPAFQAGAGRRFRVTRHLFGTLEGKVTYGRASVGVAGGRARTSNLAFHGLFGVGAVFPAAP